MPLHVVLIEPEIPTNTGNIGRLCLATGSQLHLVRPLGFEIDDSRLKRAGLDYWQHLDVHTYDNAHSFFETHKDKAMAFFSSHATNIYLSLDFEQDLYLIFGKESVGLAKEILEEEKDRLYKIPLFSDQIRSLNLANAVAVIVYEGLRQLQGP
ncbi:MAG: tRNA (cytidine(34)-2'-O)-methyltransferase [Bacteroidota bacterium]